MPFASRLFDRVKERGNPVVVGIDPRLDQLPPGWLEQYSNDLAGRAVAVSAFARAVIDLVSPLVPAVKFQSAFFELLGPFGTRAMEQSARYARGRGLIVIIDGKRNDIGSTAEAYAQAYLSHPPGEPDGQVPWCADALTINPYLGSDGVQPFLETAAANNNGAFCLVRTSNPSARDFQDLVAHGVVLYRHVAARLALWAEPHRDESGYSLLGAVIGATYPHELAELRSMLPGVIFLVPGYGSQGGTARDVAAAFDSNGLGAIINSSRGIAGAFTISRYRDRFGDDWEGAIVQATHDMIEDLAAETSAKHLRAKASDA